MDKSSDLYQKIAKVHAARKQAQIWDQEMVERYMADDFYAFSRGKFLVALTNKGSDINQKVNYTPFDEGETVCNIFYPTSDCQQVQGGVNVSLKAGE
jgi:alpha-amylase